MGDHLQNRPEEVERLLSFAQHVGKDAIYTYYEEKARRLGHFWKPVYKSRH
jgi:hypothetical protein